MSSSRDLCPKCLELGWACHCRKSRPPEAANEIERLREALTDAREAIASLPEDGLGMAQIAFGTPGVDVYPIRDELLAKIDEALSLHKDDRHE